MAIIKSAQKRVGISRKKTLQNRILKSRLKTAIKKFEHTVATGEDENVVQKLSATQKLIDQSAAKGIIHKNKAAREKSRLAKLVNVSIENTSMES